MSAECFQWDFTTAELHVHICIILSEIAITKYQEIDLMGVSVMDMYMPLCITLQKAMSNLLIFGTSLTLDIQCMAPYCQET